MGMLRFARGKGSKQQYWVLMQVMLGVLEMDSYLLILHGFSPQQQQQ